MRHLLSDREMPGLVASDFQNTSTTAPTLPRDSRCKCLMITIWCWHVSIFSALQHYIAFGIHEPSGFFLSFCPDSNRYLSVSNSSIDMGSCRAAFSAAMWLRWHGHPATARVCWYFCWRIVEHPLIRRVITEALSHPKATQFFHGTASSALICQSEWLYFHRWHHTPD